MKMLVTVLTLVVALAGCGGDLTADRPDAFRPDVSREARAAVDDLVAELEVDVSDVESVEVEKVTWNDGSLGCATKGEMYSLATVEGQRITIEVDGETYEYHQGGDRAPFLCEDPTE